MIPALHQAYAAHHKFHRHHFRGCQAFACAHNLRLSKWMEFTVKLSLSRHMARVTRRLHHTLC